jgi:hypothetical protein
VSIVALVEALHRSVEGEPWHGPGLSSLLGDVTDEEARAHPVAGAHSILEIVLHMGAWAGEVAARLEGRTPRDPDAGDWPAAAAQAPGEDGWAAARASLFTAQRALRDAVSHFPETRLAEAVGGNRDAALGTGVSYAAMIMGLCEHNAYHGGQIALLKRSLRSS